MIEEKSFKILQREVDKIIDEVEVFEYKDVHETSLKYLFNNNKKRFKEVFKSIFWNEFLLNYLKNKGTLVYPIKSFEMCSNCGDLINLYFDGKTIYSDNQECFSEKVFSVDINIPSGKFILADWVPYGEEILKIERENINTLKGRFLQSKNYEKSNVMHFFIGNTSPLVSQKNNEIIIESPGYYEDEDGEDVELFYDESFESKGSICTDL